MKKNYKWTIRLALLTPILAIVCLILLGGGHGWSIPAVFLFPWATLNTAWQDHLSEPFMAAGLFQYIVYGVLIDKVSSTERQRYLIAGIVLVHLILVLFILQLRSSAWL